MASEQMYMRENTTDQLEIEKDSVPKMTTHSESLSEKVRNPDVTGGEDSDNVDAGVEKGRTEKQRETEQETESYADRARNANMVKEKEAESNRERNREMEGEEREGQGPSLEEISKYRETAQQNSIDAIRAAEERYNKAKELGTTAFQNLKESVGQGFGAAASYAVGKGAQAKDTIVQKGSVVKDTALEKGQQGYLSTKDTLVSASQTTSEKAKNLAPTSLVSDTSLKAAGVREKAVDVTKNVAGYTGEKVAAGKDATVETGKSAAGYAGEVAVTVKDKAVVAGWEAAHFTFEKSAEATEKAASVAQGVAGYVGEKAVAAKDVVAEKVVAAKDAIVAAEESAAEFAARRKEEAKTELESKVCIS